jgi:hypothetical protein
MFTAIILASRLANVELVVAFLMLAIICFALFPGVARLVMQKSLRLHLVLTVTIWLGASVALLLLDTALLVAFEVGMCLIWIVGPYIYFKMQFYKRAMKGPWDIAEVE